MLQVLGSAKQTTGMVPAGDAHDPRDADRGLGGHGATPPVPETSLQRESTSGVEWLPRHKPHRWI